MNAMQRSTSLKQFRTFCFLCTGTAFVILVLISLITFASSILWVAGRVALLSALIGTYFLIIGVRTHVIIVQCSRGTPQTFDRPAPEWITAAFGLAIIGTILWPYAR